MSDFLQPPRTLEEFFARINQFLTMYGGKAIKSSSPKSLDVMSDFLLVFGAELDFKFASKADDLATDSADEKDVVK